MAEHSVEHHEGRGRRTAEQVKEWSAAHAGERQAIRWLSRCVADLNAAKATKPEPATVSVAGLREALAQGRTSPRGAQ
jgi:predicted Fe-S protein YdhL (DUF1289 family)